MNRQFRNAFTLIELIVVIVVLGILSGVAVVKYHDMSSKAKTSADTASIGAMNEALMIRFGHNLTTGAPASSRITLAAQVVGVMESGKLPEGITLSGATFTDQRGNTYTLQAETAAAAARVVADATSGGGSGSSGGSAAIEPVVGLLVLAPWLSRPTRRRVGRAR